MQLVVEIELEQSTNTRSTSYKLTIGTTSLDGAYNNFNLLRIRHYKLAFYRNFIGASRGTETYVFIVICNIECFVPRIIGAAPGIMNRRSANVAPTWRPSIAMKYSFRCLFDRACANKALVKLSLPQVDRKTERGR